MSDIKIHKRNEAYLSIESHDTGILMEISEYYTFYVEGYKFMPAYKNKMWDGKIRLFNRQTQQLPHGLLESLINFAKDRGYTTELNDGLTIEHESIGAGFDEFIAQMPFSLNKTQIYLRDYQQFAAKHAIQNKRAILISPTGSGKSLIIYSLVTYFLEKLAKAKQHVLIIVPTTSLVEQLYKDFAEYSHLNGFSVEKFVHTIYSGKEKNRADVPITISTWQSAIRCERSWFKQFGMVIGDEAHTFKAKSLTKIMDQLENAEYRIGTTGTLDNTQVHELVLTGCFGTPKRVITTAELIENKTLEDLDIKCIALKYSDAERKEFGKRTYQEEIDYLVSYQKRNNFIKNLALDQKGNTLVLYNLVEKHGKPLYDLIINNVTNNRKVFFVSGAVGAEERERIRELTERESNAIIVASLGTFAVGINIKRLNNIIFASPTKSQIRVLQSIGRGLRKSDMTTTVYDISDNLSWKSRKNYTLLHAINRVNIYQRERFKWQIFEVPI